MPCSLFFFAFSFQRQTLQPSTLEGVNCHYRQLTGRDIVLLKNIRIDIDSLNSHSFSSMPLNNAFFSDESVQWANIMAFFSRNSTASYQLSTSFTRPKKRERSHHQETKGELKPGEESKRVPSVLNRT